MLAAGDIAIHRLRVRADKRVAHRLAQELEHASWPVLLPAQLQHAWIFVRELKVAGNVRDIRQQTAQQLGSLLHQAVDGRLASAAAASVVCFKSLPELLAFLLRDLTLGQAGKWYWSRWSHLLRHTREHAVAQLLCEHIQHLPAIINQLDKYHFLANVWHVLGSASALQVAREVARTHGFVLPNRLLLENTSASHTSETTIAEWQHPVLLKPWLSMLATLDDNDGRIILAAILHLLNYAPLVLLQNPAVAIENVATVLAQYRKRQQPAPRVPTAQAVDTLPLALQARTAWVNEVDVTQKKSARLQDIVTAEIPATELLESVKESLQKTTVENIPLAVSLAEVQQGFHHLPSGVDNNQQNNTIADDVDIAAENHRGDDEFITQCGGFFYLVNALNRVLTPELLGTRSNANGWCWLLDVMQLLCEVYPHLQGVVDPPLRRFIAQQLYPQDTPAIAEKKLQARAISEAAQELFADLTTRYNTAGFWQELQQARGFFAVPAQVIATASHIDVYFPLASVRLDVRLAAWDLNPGWVPWLGRVVNFYFHETAMTGDGQ